MQVVDTLEKLNKIKATLEACNEPAIYVKPTGSDLYGSAKGAKDKALGIAISVDDDDFYFPLRHAVGLNAPLSLLRYIKLYLGNRRCILWDACMQLQVLANDDIDLRVSRDGMLGMHLFNEREKSFALDDIAAKYGIGHDLITEKSFEAEIKHNLASFGIITNLRARANDVHMTLPETMGEYACQKASIARQTTLFLVPALKAQDLLGIWEGLNKYAYATYKMMQAGIRIDMPLLEKYMAEAKLNYQIAVNDLCELAGRQINPSSPKEVCDLFGTMSADKEILNDIVNEGGDNGRMAVLVLEAKAWKKAANTYYAPYKKKVDANNDLHCSYNMVGTYTGRLSCASPNLQAVAKRTDTYKVKDVFVAREGCILIQADYKQAEMRLAAHYAKDEKLCSIIESGVDMHEDTANAIGMPREVAKRINFSVLYGVGYNTLSKIAGISVDEARDYLERFHDLYPGFRKLAGSYEGMAIRNGYITLWTGRRQHFEVIGAETHKAMANLIQGGVAEMMRISVTRLHEELAKVKGRLLLQVHDSVLVEVPTVYVADALDLIRDIMCDFNFTPRPDVDLSYGKTWGSLEEYQL